MFLKGGKGTPPPQKKIHNLFFSKKLFDKAWLPSLLFVQIYSLYKYTLCIN